jgi:hypothetical protein
MGRYWNLSGSRYLLITHQEGQGARPTLLSRFPRNRHTAAALHFALSCMIFSILIALLLLLWYPSPWFSASGGWQGLKLVAAVDLVLGPLLTFIVYSVQKSRAELMTDLAIIVMIQVGALLWGIMAIYQQRPVAAVFWGGSFYTVPAAAITAQGEDLRQLQGFKRTDTGRGPVYVYAQGPQSAEEHEHMLLELTAVRVPPHEQPHRYRPLEHHFAELRQAGVDIDEIISNNPRMRERLRKILETSSTRLEDNFYVALVSRYRNIILVFGAQNELLGTLHAPLKQGPQ